MVIIFDKGDEFWIEQHLITHTSVATATIDNTELNFDRIGNILAITTSSTTANAVSGFAQFFTRAGANGVIRIGTELGGVPQTGVRSRLRNDSGGTITVSMLVTVMLRKGST